MKKIFLISFLALLTMFTHAQTEAKVILASNGLAIDTVSNTGTETWTIKAPGYQKTVAVQFVATKISGTVAGSVTLQGSLNGTNWATVPSQSAFTATDVASQTAVWKFDDGGFLYYRLSWTGAGTMSASGKAYILTRN
jgi:hypothetical protein